MTEAQLTDLLAILLIVEVVLAVLATAYIVRVYRKAKRRSPLFRDVTWLSVLITVGGVAIMPPVVVALLDLPRMAYTGPVVGLVLMAMLYAPIAIAARYWRLRRPPRKEIT